MNAVDERKFCPAVNGRTGWRCDFAAHPWQTHWTWVEGELKVWSTATPTWTNVSSGTEDPLRDAPERLRDVHEETYAGWTEKQRRTLYAGRIRLPELEEIERLGYELSHLHRRAARPAFRRLASVWRSRLRRRLQVRGAGRAPLQPGSGHSLPSRARRSDGSLGRIVSGRRSLILAAALRAGTAWEESGETLTDDLRAALADLLALTGTEDCPEPNDALYLVLREDWGHWIVQAVTDGQAREKYVKEVPHLGFRGIFRDTHIPLWIPQRGGEDEP